MFKMPFYEQAKCSKFTVTFLWKMGENHGKFAAWNDTFIRPNNDANRKETKRRLCVEFQLSLVITLTEHATYSKQYGPHVNRNVTELLSTQMKSVTFYFIRTFLCFEVKFRQLHSQY